MTCHLTLIPLFEAQALSPVTFPVTAQSILLILYPYRAQSLENYGGIPCPWLKTTQRAIGSGVP